jgi:hypothetical protein
MYLKELQKKCKLFSYFAKFGCCEKTLEKSRYFQTCCTLGFLQRTLGVFEHWGIVEAKF